MVALVLIFWLLLWCPGFVLARRAGWSSPGMGALSHVALGYVAACAAFGVVAAFAYVVGAPLWVLSIALVVGIVLSLREIIGAARSWRWSWRWPHPVAAIGTLVLVADLLLGVVRGGHLGGDAAFHIARTRMLVDHGFNNWDPYIAGHFFSRVYQTNVYHALMAAAAQLTGYAPVNVWLWTLPWAKLVIAAGTYHLAWTVTRSRALAWCASSFVVVRFASVAFVLYPNKLAPLWLLPMALSALVMLWEGQRPRAALTLLAAVSLVLAQVHVLYALFACIGLGPLLAWQLGVHSLRRREGRRVWAVAIVALLVCVPWLLAARFVPTVSEHTQVQAPPEVALDAASVLAQQSSSSAVRVGAQPGFTYLSDGSFMLDPGVWLKPMAWLPVGVLLLGLLTERRRAVLPLLLVSVAVSLVLYVPWICTPVTRALGGSEWVIGRYGALRAACYAVSFPWLVLLLWPRVLDSRVFMTLTVLGTLVWADARGVDGAGTDRARYLDGFRKPSAPFARSERREAESAFYRAHVQPGSTMIAPLGAGTMRAAIADVYLVGVPPATGSPGVPHLALRRAHLSALLRSGLTAPDRARLLRHYGVRHLYMAKRGEAERRLRKVYKPWITGKQRIGRGVLYTLRPVN